MRGNKTAFIIALIGVLLAACLGCNRGVHSLPPELLGFWTTDSPAYKERYIKFENDYVLFGVGDDESPTIQRISKIESKKNGDHIVYTFYSRDADGAHQLIVSYSAADGGTLRIKNQKDVIWKRFNSSSNQRFRGMLHSRA